MAIKQIQKLQNPKAKIKARTNPSAHNLVAYCINNSQILQRYKIMYFFCWRKCAGENAQLSGLLLSV